MHSGSWMAGVALVVFTAVGCEDSKYQEYSNAPLNELQEHDHDHGSHAGAHNGHVLELDDAHGHHAEMVFDAASRDITLYFYGSEIGVAKAAKDLAFEIEKDGKEVVLESETSPLEGETDENCSRFVIAGSQLPEEIKSEEQLDGHFHVTIDGKEFTYEFHAHSHNADHAHDDHEHEKADHAKDEHADEKAAPGDAADKSDVPAVETPDEKTP